ncbi:MULTISPECIES: thioredoxin family protein [unclassified Cryobacterium]|uniref:TlpA family protein disulfide reductase n=1 Tax=unclassified Cryobacterium TaxID=2649013 RepID=UPI001069AF57|nr:MULTISPECIES: thioredoxin family protein [unclassified Cryobacterium]TFC54939.1 thioredoxin [Cryobacterium sp. TMB3-1-2]TFC70381.1 thioredoxin [Cryobacterium sp. TMB3-15]TFC75722.1 thioredoxin [Cryobacterium sp. TMB3-10]TFD45491.1 thioredoxin [Cryobacterium sp. TMB3-12]
MNPAAALLVLVLLVALTTALGLVWRRRQGQLTSSTDSVDAVTAAQLGLTVSNTPMVFGAEATLLQFSTEFCARCPGTSVLLGQVADARTGVRHVEVDLTHRADLARRFKVLQTPTTLVLDRAGRVRARVGGVPNRAALHAHLDDLARNVQESR